MRIRLLGPVLFLAAGALYWITSWNLSREGPHSALRGIASVDQKRAFKAARFARIEKRDSPFSHQKVILKNTLRKTATPHVKPRKSAFGATEVMPSKIRLAALVDNSCLASRNRSALTQSLGGDSQNPQLKVQAYEITLNEEVELQAFASQVESDECILGVTENGDVQMDGFYADPKSNQQLHLENINAQDSEAFFLSSSLSPPEEVVVAIIDSGIDYEHPDLASQMWTSPDGNFGHDFVNEDSSPMDDNGHGTHVAGLVAATGGNDQGGSGVAPLGVRLMAVKVLDQNGSGSFKDVANGIRFAIENEADVINISLSGAGPNALIEDALIEALNNGIPVVVSAGNSDIEIGEDWDEALSTGNARTPASLGKDLEGVITVGALDSVTSQKSSFSNFSAEYVELAAPGSNGILSTLPDDEYGEMEGTSMSTPIAAGAIALMLRTFKALEYPYTAEEVESTLTENSSRSSELEPFFKEGRHLDLNQLRQHLRYQYVTPITAGVEDAF